MGSRMRPGWNRIAGSEIVTTATAAPAGPPRRRWSSLAIWPSHARTAYRRPPAAHGKQHSGLAIPMRAPAATRVAGQALRAFKLVNMFLAVDEALRPPSRTAVLTAVARELCRQEPGTVIFDDDLALRLAGDEGQLLEKRLRTEFPRRYLRAFSRWVCIRSRFTEDLVDRAVARGVGQYVILGAGLDSFAYRRRELLDRLRVFEVDHPASQSWKRHRLSELGVTAPDNLIFTPVDFEHQTLRDGLGEAGFAFRDAALFSWIGVTMYLTMDAITATLATVARCAPGTQIVLSYNQPRDSLDDFALQVTSTFASLAAEMGEPFLSLFRRDEIAGLLRTQGFDDIVDFGAQEARADYFKANVDVDIPGAQRLVVGTVTPAAR